MKYIKKIKLFNYKKFKEMEVSFDQYMNIIIGDNEAGKSSILQAIDLVLSGSRSKIESTGIDKLLNISCVNEFMNSERLYDSLPKMVVELYFSELNELLSNGRNNSDETICDGLSLICEPADEYSREIKEIIKNENACFPYEYYAIRFIAFSGEHYSGYHKFLRHLIIDNSTVNGDYAIKEYIKSVYSKNVSIIEKTQHQNEYRRFKTKYKNEVLNTLNERLVNYEFDIRTDNKSNLFNDLTITENSIPIENKGKGRQCLAKTEFALKRSNTENEIDILLLEEPENHLSHTNMNKLIQRISESQNKQIFIATHNSMICSRLDLRNVIIINSNSEIAVKLNDLPQSTAEFFIKAPNHNILEFILSRKVLLVEGDAEFILMDVFFEHTLGHKMNNTEIHLISVGGTSFKRYLDISKLLNIKTAVVRDNDGDFQNNCIDSYVEYNGSNMKVFFDKDNSKRTFEVSVYDLNRNICEELFSEGRKTLSVQDFMLKNKSDVAFQLLSKKSQEILVPTYIQEAIRWINE